MWSYRENGVCIHLFWGSQPRTLAIRPRGLSFPLLYSRTTYTTVHIYMRKHSQHDNDERTHFFRKIIPLTLYSKWLLKGCERVMCERWVGNWTNCNILTPNSTVFSSTSFSFRWAAQSGVLRAHSPLLCAGSLYSSLSPINWLQLTELPVTPGYIIVWHPPASCERHICTEFNPSTVKAISWYLLHAPVPWLTPGSKVNMLHPYFLGLKNRT